MLSQKTHYKRLHFLDSLRGIAALLVVFHHFMVFNEKQLESWVSKPLLQIFRFISDLNVEAVLFFFVLSGFSIGLAQKGDFLDNKERTNNYFYKRFKRILPIYWLALAFAFFIGLLISNHKEASYSLNNLLGNLLFLQTSAQATAYWFSPYGNNGPLWSLAYEFFFYLFFPLISWTVFHLNWLKSRRLLWTSLFILSLFSIAINKYILFNPPFAFLSYFIIWWAGFQIARDQMHNRKSLFFWFVIIIASVLMQMFKHQVPSTSMIEIAKGLLIASLFYLLLLLNTIWHSPFKNNIKNIFNFCFEQVGHGSYALYALHYPLFIYLDHYKILWMYQIISIFGLLICCIFLEKWTIKKAFRIFKLNYMRIKA